MRRMYKFIMNFDCTSCGGNLEVDVRGMGRDVICPHCGERITIPDVEIGRKMRRRDPELSRIKALVGILLAITLFFWAATAVLLWRSRQDEVEERPLAEEVVVFEEVEHAWSPEEWEDVPGDEQGAWPEERPGQVAAVAEVAEDAELPAELPEAIVAEREEEELVETAQELPRAPVRTSSPAISSGYVVIEGRRSGGSGFVVDIAGQPFVLSNIHVVEDNQPLVMRNVDGHRLAYGSALYVSRSLDLALIPVRHAHGFAMLEMETRPPVMGQTVRVFGNSQGGGVLTMLEGVVAGVGPSRIEVTVPFVEGNSGSPIINDRGRVLAVATYAMYGTSNAISRGTRFQDVRRFGLRPDLRRGDWVRTTFSSLDNLGGRLADATAYMEDVEAMLRCWTPATDAFAERRRFEAVHTYSGMREYRDTPWNQYFINFADGYYRFWVARFSSGNPRALNPSMRNRLKGLEQAFARLLEEMKKDLNRPFGPLAQTAYFQERIRLANAKTERIERAIVDTIKSSEWQFRCIVPQLIMTTPTLDAGEFREFYFEDDVQSLIR